MKQYLLTIILLLSALGTEAQMQKGYIRTIKRPERAAKPVAQVTILVSEGNKNVLTNDKGEFSFPCNATSYRFLRVQKNGYQLVDKGVIGRLNPYSSKVAQEIVMVSQSDLDADKKRIENKAYERAQKDYQKKLDAIKKELEEKRITEQQAAQAEAKAGESLQKYIEMIDDMAKRYAMMDYEGISDKNRQILQYIENAEFEKADSLINTKGDLEARFKEIKEQQQVTEAAENLAQKMRESYTMNMNDLAEDYYNKFSIYKSKYQNDSATYCLEQRAALDTTNVEWQNEAGSFIQEYLANYAKALYYCQVVMRQSLIQYGEESDWVAASYNNIGLIYSKQGDYAKALEYFNKALAIYEKVYGTEHPDVATLYNNIGGAYYRQGDFFKTLEYHTKSLTIREKVLGNGHPDVAMSYNNIGNVADLFDYSKALEYYTKALAINEKVYGTEHPDVATSYYNVGVVYADQGYYIKALEYYTKALTIYEKVLSPEHPSTQTAKENIDYVKHKLEEPELGIIAREYIVEEIVNEISNPVNPHTPQDLERQREYTIQQFKKKVGVPLLVPFIYESTPAWHLYVTTKDSTDMKVNGVYLVDANHDDFDFDKDVYVLDSILVFNHKVGCTYKAMVSGLKNSVHKEVGIDGYMQHTISKINKGTWDYDSNIQIPIIIMRDEEEKKEENPDAPPHETQKE